MRVKECLLDWWGRSDHRRRMNVVEAALRKAGDRGRTRDELIEGTEFSLNQVRTRPPEAQGEGARGAGRSTVEDEGRGARFTVTQEPPRHRCRPGTWTPVDVGAAAPQ